MNQSQAADFVILQFIDLEVQLQDCLNVAPYIHANRQVVSPKFATILIEACSLIDSIFSDLLGAKNKTSLKDYAQAFEPSIDLVRNMTLFLNTPIMVLRPFELWRKEQPEWWAAYNSLKHDRINNFESATLENTVLALCALHQVMARCKLFLGPFLKVGWIDTANGDLVADLGSVAHLGPLTPSPPSMVIESKLFVSSTRENFINDTKESESLYLDIDYQARNLSNRVKNIIWAHEDF
jgi:hypothetical protein